MKGGIGKEVATNYEIKYIETSPGENRNKFRIFLHSIIQQRGQISLSGINHNVDELLVGLVTQIHLRREAEGSKAACKVTFFLFSQNSPHSGFSDDHCFKIYLLHNIVTPALDSAWGGV